MLHYRPLASIIPTLAIAGCLHAFQARTAVAQASCNANGANSSCSTGNLAISITISPVVQLELSSAATTLTPPTPADYNAGFAASTGPSGVVRANAPWMLLISAGSPTWTAVNTQSEPARTSKPASDLAWSLSPGGPFTDLSTTPVTVASGNATTAAAGTLYYRTRYNWALDTPGIYSIQVVLTLTAP